MRGMHPDTFTVSTFIQTTVGTSAIGEYDCRVLLSIIECDGIAGQKNAIGWRWIVPMKALRAPAAKF